VVIGNGFEIPPAEYPFPAYAWWRPPPDAALRDYERPVLEKANSVLADLGAKPMAALADLFRGLPIYLSAYPETDHYPRRRGVEYLGWLRAPGGHEPPLWPARGERKVFAYLLPGYPALDALLNTLRRSDLATLVYGPGLAEDVARRHRADNLAFAERPLDMDAVVQEAEALVCHSPGTAHAALMAGLPVLLLPTQMEQWMAARRIVELGAGICLEPAEAQNRCPEALERLLKDTGLARRARDFAAAHADAKGGALLERILAGCEGLLAGAA
jgi:UDP:flavonoid glycosyltransferase YjiC (YdhE family)